MTVKKILCFGDSNTWGHDPADGAQLSYRWTTGLAQMLPDYEITIDGACGRSTKFDVPDMSDSNGIDVFRERYINTENDFDLIIIMLGTNDQLNFFDCTAKETAETIGAYVREYRLKHGNKTEFLIISPILIRACALKHPIFGTLYSEKSVEASKNFAGSFSDMADTENAHFLDAGSIAKASDTDGIHMDIKEHRKLAQAIAEKVKEIL